MADDLEAKAPSTTALATKAREWWRRDRGFTEPKPGDIDSLVRLLRSVAAEARKEALEEALQACADSAERLQIPELEVSIRIRALAGRKEER